MEAESKRLVQPMAEKCFEYLDQSIQIFENILKGESSHSSDFYKARNLVKDADECFKTTLKNAKKLLGIVPDYVSSDFLEFKKKLLKIDKIKIDNLEYEDIESELKNDETLKKWMTQDEIVSLFKAHYLNQQEGKRKLENIKARIILEKLNSLLLQAKQLQKDAIKKQAGIY